MLARLFPEELLQATLNSAQVDTFAHLILFWDIQMDSRIVQLLEALGLQLWEPGFASSPDRPPFWVWAAQIYPSLYRSNKPQV